MSQETKIETLDSAEKAFAEAASVTAVAPAAAEPVAVEAAPVEASVVIPALKPKAAKSAQPKIPAAKKPITMTVKKPAIKAAAPVAKPVAKPAAKLPPKAPRVAKPVSKEKPMTKTTKTADFTAKIKGAFADVQGKAKAAYAKGSEAVGEATEFAKGNVEAVVDSAKIVTEGLKTLGSDYVAESKKAYETVTADAKALAAVKSPTEFFELQTSLLKRNFESAIALTSKNTEAAVKLASDAFAPISSRVALAVEKVKKAA